MLKTSVAIHHDKSVHVTYHINFNYLTDKQQNSTDIASLFTIHFSLLYSRLFSLGANFPKFPE